MASSIIPTEFNVEHRLNAVTMLFVAAVVVLAVSKGKK